MAPRASRHSLSDEAPPASERLTLFFGRVHNVGRFRRGAGRAALWLAATLTFSAALVGGALLHLDLAPTRRIARAVANAALATPFRGTIEVGPISRLHPLGAEIDEVRILDADGRVVIRAWGVRGGFETWRFLRTLADGRMPLDVIIPEAQVERAEVWLVDAGGGVPTIASAFDERIPTVSDPASQSVRVQLPRISLGRVDVHGDVGVPIEATISAARGRVRVTGEAVSVDVEDTPLELRSIIPGGVRGAASYHLRAWIADAPRPPGTPELAMWADFSGEASGVGAIARWELVDDHMEAHVDLPKILPRELHALLPDAPLISPAHASFTAEGPVDLLDLQGRVEIEAPDRAGPAAVIMLEGTLGLADDVALETTFYARDVDASALVEGAPSTRVDGRGRAFVRVDAMGPHVSVDVATDPTIIAGQAVPAIDTNLVVGAEEVILSARAHEPGAPIDAVLRVLPDTSLRFGAELRSDSLRAVSRLGGAADGTLRAEIRGRMVDGKIDARYLATARGARVGDLRIADSTLRGTIAGPPPDFEIAAEATATGVVVGGKEEGRLALQSAVVRLRGPIASPFVVAEAKDATGGDLRAEAQIDVAAQALRGVAFSIDRDGDRVEGKAARLALVGGGIDLAGLSLAGDGVGSLRGSLRVAGGELSGALRGENVDLARASRLAGFRVPIAGVMNVDLAMRPTRGGRTGHIELELERGQASVVHGISARLSAKFEDDEVEAAGYVRLVDEATAGELADQAGSGPDAGTLCDGAIAEVRLSGVEGTLVGPLLQADTWMKATGEAELNAERWNLHCLARRFPFVVPLSDLRGTLTTRLRVSRDDDDRIPSIESLYVRTRDLEIAGPKPLLGEPAWASRAIDVEIEASLDGKSGVAPFEVTLFDETYLAVSKGRVDLDGVIAAGMSGARAALEDAPFEIALEVPRRGFDELGSLPTPARENIPAFEGDLRLDATASGTLRAPSLGATLKVFGLQPPGAASEWAPPIDGEATFTYEAATGSAILAASAQLENATVAHVVAGAEVPYQALRAGGPGPLPWRGGVTATLNELPLGSFPILADRGIQGAISGHASVAGLNEVPSVDVELDLPFVQLGDAYFDGKVRATIKPAPAEDAALAAGGSIDAAQVAPNLAVATLDLELRDQDDGALELLSHARVSWADGFVPTIDDQRRGGVAMSAESFRLAALAPVVSGVLSKLDGYLDGTLVFEWGDAAGRGRIASANLAVTEGIVYVPTIGQELHGVEAQLVSDGPGDFVVRDVVAEGMSGRVTASGRAKMDGLTFDQGAAVIVIDEDEQLPLTFEGVPLGRAYGRVEVDVAYHPEANLMDVEVVIPELQLAMQSVGTRSVQGLDEHPEVFVNVPLGPPEEESRSADAIRWEIGVDIAKLRVLVGDLARVEVRTKGRFPGGEETEPVVIRIEEELSMSGDLVVTEGAFDFLGKEFELDAGLVRLNDDDPGNPFVNVTAHWEGPDGGRIMLDYVGDLLPITDEKIRLRSDPARSEREILATLIFGDSLSDIPQGGSSAGGGEGEGSMAGSVGASVASSGLNSILKNSVLSRFSAELGTTDEGNFRSGFEVELTDSFTLGAANERIQEGTDRTTSGAVQQRGAQELNELSAEWRFYRNWSLRGTFGQRDTQTTASSLFGLDVLWQYRY